MQLKVSILIPIYGVEKYIERCLCSLFEQTYKDIEYIFVDDCTFDKSSMILYDIVAKYPERARSVVIIRNEKNMGIAAVRNILLKNATGHFLYFVDSDDWIERECITELVNKAIFINADIVGCDFYEEEKDRQIYVKQQFPFTAEECLCKILYQDLKTVLWNKLIRKSLFEDSNLYFEPGINLGEDYIMCVKLYSCAKIVSSVSKPLYHYCKYNEYSYTKIYDQNYSPIICMIDKAEEYCRNIGNYNRVQKYINMRKFILKQKIYYQNRNTKFWYTLYPEANHAWIYFDFNRKMQFLYWSLEHRFTLFLDILWRIKKFLGKK